MVNSKTWVTAQASWLHRGHAFNLYILTSQERCQRLRQEKFMQTSLAGALGVVLTGRRSIISLHSISIISWTVLHFADNESEVPSYVNFFLEMCKSEIQELVVEHNSNFVAGAQAVNCNTGSGPCRFPCLHSAESRATWKGLKFPFVITWLILLIGDSQPSFPDILGFSNYLKPVKKSSTKILL